MSQKLIAHFDTEPIFNIHIEFCNGSKPIEYFNLNLKQAMVALQEWSDDWILYPDSDCQLNGEVWSWHARTRHKQKNTAEKEESSDLEEVVPLNDLEFTEPEE